MDHAVLSAWLASAIEVAGASTVRICRPRAKDARASWPVANISPGEILQEAIADLVSRGMRAGRFAISVHSEDGATLRNRIIDVSKDDDSGDEAGDLDPHNPWQSIANAMARTIESQNRTIIELSKGSSQELRLALGELANRYAEGEGRIAEALTTMYEMATAKDERIKEERASNERREVFKSGFETLGPILGAIATHWKGSSDPAVLALLGSLTDAQLQAILPHLTAEQQAAIGAAVEAYAKGNAAPKADAPKGA